MRREVQESSIRRRRSLDGHRGGRDKKRAPVEVPQRHQAGEDTRAYLPRRMFPGDIRGQHRARAEGEEVGREGRLGLDGESPGSWEGPARRVRPPEARGPGGRCSQPPRGERRGSVGSQGQEREKRKGEGEEEKGEATEEHQSRTSEEKRRKGSRGRPRRKWTGSRSEEKEALSSKSKALDEEEKEKEEFFVFEPEQFKGRQQWEQRLDSHGRIGALWPDKNGQKGGGSVPGSANSLLAVGRSGAAPDVPRSNVGPGQAGVAPYIPAIFQGPPGGPDAACHEKGGGPRLLLPGLGVAGEDPTVAGHASSALDSVGRSDHGKTLVRHFPIRASTRRTGVGGDSARNAGGCPGSQGSQQAEEYGWEAVRERPRKGRRMEERKPKRQGLKRARQRKGVAKRLKGRRTGFSARERGREGQGEEQRERRMTMRGADPLRRQNGQGAVRGHASLGEEVRGLAPGLSTPGLGVKERLSGMRFEVSPAKAPHTFVEAVWDEEEKSSLAWEYPPSETRHGTTPFFERESGNLEGRKVVEMGDLLNEILDGFQSFGFLHSRSQPLGIGTEQIFPLPLSSEIIRGSAFPSMAPATCRALNYLHGETAERQKQKLSAGCKRALEFVVRCVDAMGSWDECFTPVNFDAFFLSKGVDYRGEEVKVAQRICWDSISPAFPPEVGGVSLLDFCTLGTKFYVEHFPDFLVPPEKQFLGKTPTVMVRDGDWGSVCKGLLECRVCGILPLEEVFHIRGRPLLGGLFGVGKGEFSGNLEIQRLIMNFIPLNDNCRPLDSDIATLPGISGLTPFFDWRGGGCSYFFGRH